MTTIEIFWIVIVGTIVVVTLVAFIVGIVLVNQRKFIRIQQEKLRESERLQNVLREIPNRVLQAQEEERRRVSMDLHDGINQMLASIKYRLHSLRETFGRNQSQLGTSLEGVSADLHATMEEIRRISHNLRPKILDDLGFQPAVRNLCDEFTARTRIQVSSTITGLAHHLPHEIELGTFRILQEAFQNIEKHASATKVTLTVETAEAGLGMEIVDNGKGVFPVAGPDGRQNGLGMATMKERAIVMGGKLTVSSDDGMGTTIRLYVPL